MDTDRIMAIALELAGQDRVPADSAVFVPGVGLREVMMGIDVDSGEILAAKEMGFDGVIAHHPLGGSTNLGLLEVFGRHAEILARHGVPREAADAAVAVMRAEQGPWLHATNSDRQPSIARMLKMPLMSIHNPADELGRRLMDEKLRSRVKDSDSVERAVEALNEFPEFEKAETDVVARMGDPEARLGKYVVSHGAGTNGGYPVASAAFRHGIDTVFYIHIDPGHLERLRREFPEGKNLVVCGLLAADSVGLNPLVRRLRQEGLKVETMGGIIED